MSIRWAFALWSADFLDRSARPKLSAYAPRERKLQMELELELDLELSL